MSDLEYILSKQEEAKKKPDKAIRVCAGFYFYFSSKVGLIEIDRVEASKDDTDWSGWVSKAHNRSFVNDPVSTLSEVLEDLKYI